jgi:hypothetical protein
VPQTLEDRGGAMGSNGVSEKMTTIKICLKYKIENQVAMEGLMGIGIICAGCKKGQKTKSLKKKK